MTARFCAPFGFKSSRIAFPHINVAVVCTQGKLWSSAIDRADYAFVDFQTIKRASASVLLNRRAGRSSLQLEGTVNFPFIRAHLQVGFRVFRKSDVDLPMIRSKRHWLLGVELTHGDD